MTPTPDQKREALEELETALQAAAVISADNPDDLLGWLKKVAENSLPKIERALLASLSTTDEVTDEDILRIFARCCRAAGNLAETAFTRVFAQCLAEQGYTITRRK